MKREFIAKFKTRERWRLILASCERPTEIAEIYANQPKKSLSINHVYKLCKLFAKCKLLDEKSFNGRLNWTLTPVGRKILELWPVPTIRLDYFGNPNVSER